MRRITLAAALLIAAPALAQQAMPGMDMGPQDRKKPAHPMQMPGMNMGKPNTMQMPGDMQHPAPNDPKAQQETQSMENSESQQKAQQGTVPGPASDALSPSHSTLTLQEPENPHYRTGADLPAPELLNDVAKRPPMRLEQFTAMAGQRNPTLAQAQQYVRRSEQQGRQAGLYPNPIVGYSGDHIRGGDYHGGEQGAFVQQEFVLGGKLGLRRDIFRQEAQANQAGVEIQQYRVKNTVEQNFYLALTAQAEVVVRQRMLKVALDAVETAHQLANVGQADAPDVLQAEVEAEQAKVDFEHAERAYLQQFGVLAAVAGAQDLAPAPLEGALEQPPELNAEQQVAAVVAGSPTVKQARQLVAVAEARLKDAKRESFPNLNVQAGEWYSGEPVGDGAYHAAGFESFVSAGVNLPIFNRNQGNVEAAKVELERARADVARTELALKEAADPLAQGYLSSRFEAARYRDQMLPRARRAYELYLMKYQQMAAAYPEVLVSQRTLFQLQIGYLHALGAEWANALALQNFTLSGGLGMPLSVGADTTTLNLPTGGNY